MQKVYALLKESQELKLREDQWSRVVGKFGRNMEAMCMMVHALGYDVDLEEYPRWEYQGDTIPNRGHQEEATVDAENERRDGAREADGGRFVSSLGSNRRGVGDHGAWGWDTIDILSTAQCARMPTGMRTVEFIPKSLQDEWSEAWNVTHRRRDAAETEEDKERDLKWIL